MRTSFKIRRATEKDIAFIKKSIVEWLSWETSREESIGRAIKNRELLIADQQGKVIGFIHYVMHEDIIDGGLNSFITAFYVVPEFRKKGVGSILLRRAIQDALDRGAVGMETSTASSDARRLYERHHFEQFIGKEGMGEVFLELDVQEYKRNVKMRCVYSTSVAWCTVEKNRHDNCCKDVLETKRFYDA